MSVRDAALAGGVSMFKFITPRTCLRIPLLKECSIFDLMGRIAVLETVVLSCCSTVSAREHPIRNTACLFTNLCPADTLPLSRVIRRQVWIYPPSCRIVPTQLLLGHSTISQLVVSCWPPKRRCFTGSEEVSSHACD